MRPDGDIAAAAAVGVAVAAAIGLAAAAAAAIGVAVAAVAVAAAVGAAVTAGISLATTVDGEGAPDDGGDIAVGSHRVVLGAGSHASFTLLLEWQRVS